MVTALEVYLMTGHTARPGSMSFLSKVSIRLHQAHSGEAFLLVYTSDMQPELSYAHR